MLFSNPSILLATSFGIMETTVIYQLSTLTPLAASSDDSNTAELLQLKQKIKQIIPRILNENKNNEVGNIVSKPFTIHYKFNVDNDLLIITITSDQFPNQLALSYIYELYDEFNHIYSNEIRKIITSGEIIKPYQFMTFETFISKTKKIYSDSRAKNGTLNDINSQLQDVKNIMNKNINDLLNRGEELNNLQDLSNSLKEQSVKYRKYAKKINWDLLVKQYAPLGIVAIIILLIMYRWFK